MSSYYHETPVARVQLEKDLNSTDRWNGGSFVIPKGTIVILNQDGDVMSKSISKRMADKLPFYYSFREARNSIANGSNTFNSARTFPDCGAGRERNPKTNRCRKIRTSPSIAMNSGLIDPNDYFGAKDILTKAYREGKISDDDLDRAFVDLEHQVVARDILDKLAGIHISSSSSTQKSNSLIDIPDTKQYKRIFDLFQTIRDQTQKYVIRNSTIDSYMITSNAKEAQQTVTEEVNKLQQAGKQLLGPDGQEEPLEIRSYDEKRNAYEDRILAWGLDDAFKRRLAVTTRG